MQICFCHYGLFFTDPLQVLQQPNLDATCQLQLLLKIGEIHQSMSKIFFNVRHFQIQSMFMLHQQTSEKKKN